MKRKFYLFGLAGILAAGTVWLVSHKSEIQKDLSGTPDIKSDCTSNGFGQGRCTFHNVGSGAGTICVKITFERPYLWNGQRSSFFMDSAPVCSGIVKAEDVVQREFSGFTMRAHDDGAPIGNPSTPMELCRNGDTDWRKLCELSVSPVSAQ